MHIKTPYLGLQIYLKEDVVFTTPSFRYIYIIKIVCIVANNDIIVIIINSIIKIGFKNFSLVSIKFLYFLFMHIPIKVDKNIPNNISIE